MITKRQIELVQESFALVVPVAISAARDFYRRLFLIAPDTEELFHGDMDAQGRKLFLTLASVVDSLDRLDAILPVAEALAVRHVSYHVEDEHYRAVGLALLETLAAALGSRFDAETHNAWAAAYELLSQRMIAAARRSLAA